MGLESDAIGGGKKGGGNVHAADGKKKTKVGQGPAPTTAESWLPLLRRPLLFFPARVLAS